MLVFECKKFDLLSLKEVHDMYALRAAVFVVEQDCVYQDVDGNDLSAYHILGKKENKIVAYARLLAPGVSYANYASIGRVVTSKEIRGKEHGHQLMEYCIKQIKRYFPTEKIKISAQAHLEKFYNKHAFMATGEAYLEDGIPHIGMILKS
jgi:ElaA protein